MQALGTIEVVGLAAGIEAADVACKAANVELVGYELAKGGGYVTIKVLGQVGAVTAAIDRQIEEVDAACRFVQARRKSARRTLLCFDEWNVWYKATGGDGRGKRAPHLLEDHLS